MLTYRTLSVELGDRSYPIHIGSGLLDQGETLRAAIGGKQVLIVSNDVVFPLYGEALEQALNGYRISKVIIPDGEQHKTLHSVTLIFDKLLQEKFDRRCTIIALGGGVVGDIAGFAAACYQRGVDFIQVPTTLLAQVDSSVGGKTGVNHPLGKNMIGAFHQPRCVIADTDTLKTLDNRQLSAGIAEVIKYGLIRETSFFEWIEENVIALLNREASALAYAIEYSCRMKADIVAEDEKEAGIRALLNLGHTFGHAIEAAMGYGTWLHGEAVAAGTCMAARLSRKLKWLNSQDVSRIENLFIKTNLPTRSPRDISVDLFIELMAVDKKVLDGVQRLILLKKIGEATICEDIGKERLRDHIDEELLN